MIDAAGGKPREAAQAAKECLVQRGAYSAKTLSLNVWKPDRERPGRHHVYVTRYSQFLVQLFEDTEDWEALSVIAKRIRKKTDMYFEHTKLWEDVCGALLRVSPTLFVLVWKIRDTLTPMSLGSSSSL